MEEPICLHLERVDGVSRVQVSSFGEILRDDDAELLGRVVFELGGDSNGAGQLIFDCAIRDSNELARELDGMELDMEPTGKLGVILGLGSRRAAVRGVSRRMMPRVLRACWPHSPVIFGVPKEPGGPRTPPPTLSSSVTPSSDYLQEWQVLGISFYHGDWVAFSSTRYGDQELLQVVRETIEGIGRPCVVSDEPF